MIKLVDILKENLEAFLSPQGMSDFADRQIELFVDGDAITDDYLIPFLKTQDSDFTKFMLDELENNNNIQKEDIAKVIVAIEDNDETDSFMDYYIDAIWPDTIFKMVVDMGKGSENEIKADMKEALYSSIQRIA